MNRYVVAVTGASGLIYARELLAYFATRPDLELHAVISRAGEQVLSLELGMSPKDLAPGAIWHPVDDFTSGLASGSFRARAMVVIPCSMGTLGAISQGVGPSLPQSSGANRVATAAYAFFIAAHAAESGGHLHLRLSLRRF